MRKFEKQFQFLKIYGIIFLGTLIMAFALNIFLIPNKIVTGGVSGIGTILFYVTGIKTGTWMLLINTPLFLMGYKTLGRIAMIRTVVATIFFSLLTDLTSEMFTYLFDPVISSVYGGAAFGVGMGMVFLTSATTGGSDLAAKQLQTCFPAISAGRFLLIVDTVVIVSSVFAFKDYSAALYGFLSLYISSVLIDMITGGIDFSKAVYIISEKNETIRTEITSGLQRGATIICAKGAYTGSEKQMLLCVISKSEVVKLKSIVKMADPDAFVIITDAKEVMGEGF